MFFQIIIKKNLDSSYNNGLITLIVNEHKKKFFKGITAHSTSTVDWIDKNNSGEDEKTLYPNNESSSNNNSNNPIIVDASNTGVNAPIIIKIIGELIATFGVLYIYKSFKPTKNK